MPVAATSISDTVDSSNSFILDDDLIKDDNLIISDEIILRADDPSIVVNQSSVSGTLQYELGTVIPDAAFAIIILLP